MQYREQHIQNETKKAEEQVKKDKDKCKTCENCTCDKKKKGEK